MGQKRKVAFLTLGCKVNQYETDAMEEILEQNGYEIVDFKDRADVYIINTCSVTNMADRKSRQMIHRAKKANPDAIVVATGCYVQSAEEKMEAEHMADILIGNNKKKDIADILAHYFQSEKKETAPVLSEVIDIAQTKEYENLSIHKVNEHTRAYIKIQDGCNQFCSYCIIPYTRGRIRSKGPGDVIREVKHLAEKGYKEIVLTGIHLSSYGKDLGNVTLLDVIRQIQNISGVERIRLGSLEPRIITEEFAGELKKCDKVCPHFHLSLQSGCDETLRRMNRKYTTEEYAKALDILRKYYEHPALTTDVIVGFVGETEDEFETTRRYLEKINLYEMHIFKYSVREGTRAQKMSGHLPDVVKSERSEILLSMTRQHKKEFEAWYIGKTEKVLLEEIVEKNGEKYFQGYTERYVKVAVKYDEKSDNFRQNQIVAVKIQGFLDENLMYGKVSIEF
ncbi:MAG: tRNA (N(6)-L-threonylcarbamoyladenosine(37)-C(2))-methylthiotransferase MtaB [Eubacterium sp.]|nr:tRNA (N(6)-L-threonylcarbamoyladenosine(37)-C(2))-methylthiotransferase MtaB [Eubacterium sp.]